MAGRYRLWSYLAGAAVARTGDEMSGPALLLVGLAATGSVATASVLLAALTASAAVGGPLLGALLDRSEHPGRLLAWALAAYAIGLALILLGTGALPVPVVVAVAVTTGLLNPALSGGWTAQLPTVVASDRFARANALDVLTFGAASLTGPALAGVLGSLVGASTAMVVAVVLVAAALPAAIRLPRRPTRVRTRTPLIADIRAGVLAILASGSLRAATAASTVSLAGMGMLVVCTPLLGARALGDPAHGALLLSVLAATALTVNAALARTPGLLLRPDAVVLGSVLVIGAGILCAALFTSPVAVVVAVVVVGVGEGPQLTGLFAIRHREAPEALRSQIFTTGASVKITGFAAGTALAGPLAGHSLSGCLFAAALVEVTAAVVYLACRARKAG